VLPVFGFIAFWVVVGFSVFFIAVRGGLGGARQSLHGQSHTGRRVAGVLFVVIYVGFGIALPLALLNGNNANASNQIGGHKLTAAEKQGRELFGAHCAVCHTLAAANANGKVGPDLDSLKPPKSLVLQTINNGCLQKPATTNANTNCLGYGTMPAGILQGKDAEQVAAFVAKVAGNE
jgi:mono/diheme cytochrome c family protein